MSGQIHDVQKPFTWTLKKIHKQIKLEYISIIKFELKKENGGTISLNMYARKRSETKKNILALSRLHVSCC